MNIKAMTVWGAACVVALGIGTGARAADTEIAFGLPHTPLGSARLVPEGESLLLTDLAADGSAGVRVSTGSAGGVLLDLSADGPPVLHGPGTFAGYTLSFTTLDKQGSPDQVSVWVEGGDGGLATLSIEGAFPETVTVSALRLVDGSETEVWSYTASAPYAAPLATGAIGTESGAALRMRCDTGIEKCVLAVENMYQEKAAGDSCGDGASIYIGGIGADGVAQPGGDLMAADVLKVSWDRPASAVRPLESVTLQAYGGPDMPLRLSGVGTIFQDADVKASGAATTNPLYIEASSEIESPLFESSMAMGTGGGGSGKVSLSSFDLNGARVAGYGGSGGRAAVYGARADVTGEIILEEGRELLFGHGGGSGGSIKITSRGRDSGGPSEGVVSLFFNGNPVAAGEFDIGPGIEADLAEGSLGGSQSVGTVSHPAYLCVQLLPNGTIVLVECGFLPLSSAESALCEGVPCDTYTLLLPTGSLFALPGGEPVPVDRIRVTNRVPESITHNALIFDLEADTSLVIEDLYRLAATDDPDDLDVPPIDGGFVAVGSDVCFEIPNPNAVNIQWDKDGVLLPGRNNRRLCIANVQFLDSGRYRAVFEDGNKAVQEYVVILNVVSQVPVAGLGGLGMLALGLAAGGGAVLFRRGRRPTAH